MVLDFMRGVLRGSEPLSRVVGRALTIGFGGNVVLTKVSMIAQLINMNGLLREERLQKSFSDYIKLTPQ